MTVIVGGGALGREVRDAICEALLMYDDAPAFPGVLPMRDLPYGSRVLMCVASPLQREALWVRLSPRVLPAEWNASRGYTARSARFQIGHIVLPGACISSDADIGGFCVIGFNSTIGHDVVMGDFCTLSSQVDLCGRVKLGDRVFVGSGARILPGVTVGDDCHIGAGSVVIANLPDGARVFGNSARIVGWTRETKS